MKMVARSLLLNIEDILLCIVWGFLTANDVRDLIRIDRIRNAEKYRQILIHHPILSGKRLIGNGFIF